MTIREIAKLANVSPATVSLVINDKPGVSDAKRKEVKELLNNLYFSTRKHGKTIRTERRSLLFLKYIKTGYLVEENAGFISRILDAVELECSKLNYQLRIQVEKENLASAISTIDFSDLAGVFVIGTEIDRTEYPSLNRIKVPFVVIDNSMQNFPCHSITMANEEMVHSAVTYLASLGTGPIGYIHSKFQAQNFEERAAGFYATLKELQHPADNSFLFLLEPTLKGAYLGMKRYLEQGAKLPPLIFADNDTLAIGSMRALTEFGYKIPDDMQIIGFDDVYLSATSTPPLTTLHVQRSMIGQQAVRMLHSFILNGCSGYCKLKIGSSLVLRESTKKKDTPFTAKPATLPR